MIFKVAPLTGSRHDKLDNFGGGRCDQAQHVLNQLLFRRVYNGFAQFRFQFCQGFQR